MNLVTEILEKYNINGFDKPGGTDKASDHSYDGYYSEILSEYKDKEITLMEIGVQYGGSILLWNDLLPKSKMVFIDIVNSVHNKIWESMDKSRYDFIVDNAFDDKTIETLKTNYNSGFDVIIEDGPHTLESQIFTIKNYSKLLNPGGILIIEDIQKYEDCDILIKQIDKTHFKSVEVIDLRNNKNRYDDILVVVKK
jgi:cephalosporin hydroxylase